MRLLIGGPAAAGLVAERAVVAVRIGRARFRAIGVSVVLIAALAGGGLTAGQAARAPRPARSASLDLRAGSGHFLGAVSCLPASFGMGVGPEVDATLFTAPYSQVWDGARWRTAQVPNRNPHLDGLFGVWCTSAKSCVAVGGQEKSTDITLIWNGRSWRVSKAGSPAGILGVSCASARLCVATGQVHTTSTLAKIWNGRTWKLLKTLNP